MAYDAPTGETYIIVIPQALYLGNYIDYTLLCPNQLRHHGVVVDDVPRHLSLDPSQATHSIFFPEENVRIPLEMRGVISLFHTRAPSADEIENCKWLCITSEQDWDPHSEDFDLNERATTSHSVPRSHDRTIFPLATDPFMSYLAEFCPTLDDTNLLSMSSIATTNTTTRGFVTTKESLANLWGISLTTAAQTLKVTTQKGVRNSIHPITRRFATKQSRLRYNQLSNKHGRFYSDTFFSSVVSSRGNTMAQLFINDIQYTRVFPMKRKSEAGLTLQELIQDIGIPSALHCDGALELQYGKWKELCSEYGIRQTITEPYSPWQNRTEMNIRELKKKVSRLMTRAKAPLSLWDYCAVYVAEITCFTSNNTYDLHGRTPHEVVTGNTPDISEYVEFRWYQPIFYLDDVPFPYPKRIIGRWLGVAHRVGQALCYWILTDNGKVIARTTVQKPSPDELRDTAVISQIDAFDGKIKVVFDQEYDKPLDENRNIYLQDVDDANIIPYDDDAVMPEADVTPDVDSYDSYISSRVILPRGDLYERATVTRRKRDHEGNLIGKAHTNPLLDSRVYEVTFSDGHVGEYSTNVIAENIFATVDEDGFETKIFKDILDHRYNPNTIITEDDSWIISHNGNRVPTLGKKTPHFTPFLPILWQCWVRKVGIMSGHPIALWGP
jgi:hypothetical protein